MERRVRGATELLRIVGERKLGGVMERAGTAVNTNKVVVGWFSPWIGEGPPRNEQAPEEDAEA